MSMANQKNSNRKYSINKHYTPTKSCDMHTVDHAQSYSQSHLVQYEEKRSSS